MRTPGPNDFNFETGQQLPGLGTHEPTDVTKDDVIREARENFERQQILDRIAETNRDNEAKNATRQEELDTREAENVRREQRIRELQVELARKETELAEWEVKMQASMEAATAPAPVSPGTAPVDPDV